MTRDEVITKIKERGYWRVNFQPNTYVEKLSIPECKSLVEKNSISLRGWNYPHIPNDPLAMSPGNNYYEAWFDSRNSHIKEFWRLYQSGQFIHYVSTHYDWIEGLKLRNIWTSEDEEQTTEKILGVMDATYQITEIFQFLAKLTSAGIYDEGVSLEVSINNSSERYLVVDNSRRIPFSTLRKSQEDVIQFKKEYSKSEILSNPVELTLEVIVHFFVRFNWLEPNIEVIKVDIENLLNHKV